MTEGEQIRGSRAAHGVRNVTQRANHASDMEDGLPTAHNPWPMAAGEAAVSDGAKLVPVNVLTEAEHLASGDAAPHHAAVTVSAGSDPALTLTAQQLTLANVLTPAEFETAHTAIGNDLPHHNPVTLGAGSDPALALDGQTLTLTLPPGGGGGDHAPVTLGVGSDPALVLGGASGQELTLANVLTPAEFETAHTAIGNAAPHHAQVTLGAGNSPTLTLGGASGQALTLTPIAQSACINVVIDGGGAVITTGVKCDIELPWAAQIERVTLLADQTGSIVVDVWRDTYANYPPVVGDSITGSAPPTITSGIRSQDSTLTGWTRTLAAGDILRFNVNSCATIQRVTLSLLVTRQ